MSIAHRARPAVALALLLGLGACGGSSSAEKPVCPPLAELLTAATLYGPTVQGTVPGRGPVYLQHVIDAGVDGLTRARPLVQGQQAADVGAQLEYWTTAQRLFASTGYNPNSLTPDQQDEFVRVAERTGSAYAGRRLEQFATDMCGQGVRPTPEELRRFS